MIKPKKDAEISDLEKLLNLIDKRTIKRSRIDENGADSAEDIDKLLFGEEDDEISQDEDDDHNFSVSRDYYDSFNQSYIEYAENNKVIETSMSLSHQSFNAYNVDKGTPLLQQVMKQNVVSDPIKNPEAYRIAKQLVKRLEALSKQGKVPSCRRDVRYLFNCINTYLDVLYVNNRTGALDEIRFIYSLHIANHLLKTVLLKKEESTDGKEPIRTDGFTRPKVLIICGLKCIAKEIIDHLILLLPTAKKVSIIMEQVSLEHTEDGNLERLDVDFTLLEEDLLEQSNSYKKTRKSRDFVDTFSGNQDDAFKIGLRYQSGLLHLYSPFYSSDIIIASPLGLKAILGTKKDKDADYDFLSSIEILICDRLDIIKFQNWKFFIDLYEFINLPLLKWRDGDINRIRMSVIDGQVSEYRQNIMVACANNIIINSLFKKGPNKRGHIRLVRPYSDDYILLGSKCKIQQFFIKVPSNNIKNHDEDLLSYFSKNMLNTIDDKDGILIVLGDYTHYLRIYKDLRDLNINYLTCHESNSNKQISYARQQFYTKNVQVLITTFRYLFFKRHIFKGVDTIFIVQPSEYPPLYKDCLKMLADVKGATIVSYYTRYNAMIMEPVVGISRLSKLIEAADTRITQFH